MTPSPPSSLSGGPAGFQLDLNAGVIALLVCVTFAVFLVVVAALIYR